MKKKRIFTGKRVMLAWLLLAVIVLVLIVIVESQRSPLPSGCRQDVQASSTTCAIID